MSQEIERTGDIPEEFRTKLRDLKLDVITQAGHLDFLEGDAKFRLAQIQLQKAENEKLAIKIRIIETRFDMFMLGKRNEEM